ncbi:tape measure protein [Faecalibacter bovis]|uniref:Tape measure protein n=1 Tax=Faecalibacter bovis TaxID=2898187 RepID=A0ABX7XDR0_9FLAO|nr:tape measure protein [Faecalibacter bovis]QTV06044.1 tape measure protein [Faecalibacter bovis]
MAGKSKLELLIELSDKMFNSGLNRVQNKLNSSVNAMEGRLNQFKANASRALNSFATESESAFGFGIGAGIGMKVFDIVTNAITGLAGEAVNSADSLEKFKSTMNFAGFDTSQIDKARLDVKKYADDTVYDLNTIANTSAQLAANGVKDYLALTQAAGNLNAVAGGNADTYKSVALVLTQVNGAGKLVTQDWNQLANAIPGASGKMQDALRKNGAFTGNFREAMEKGMISAEHFNKALMDLGFQQVAIDAAKSTATFEGALGQLEAEIVNGLMSVINAIGMDNITGAIMTLTNFIGGLTKGFVWLFNEINGGNPYLQILLTLIAGLTAGIIAGNTYMLIHNTLIGKTTILTKLWAGAQSLLNLVMKLNPIGLVVAAIVALVAIVVIAIKKYDEWGAALLAFLGPVGLVINAFKSLYDHWESIKKAFQTDGIIGGLKRIGIVLLDALLKPLQQVLEMASKIPGMGNLAGNGAKSIEALRKKLDLVTPEETKTSELAKKTEGNGSASLYGASGGIGKKDDKKDKKQAERLSKMTGASNQVRNVTINIDAFNKGGINIAKSDTAGMTKADVEAWFADIMQRVMINAEHG